MLTERQLLDAIGKLVIDSTLKTAPVILAARKVVAARYEKRDSWDELKNTIAELADALEKHDAH